MANDPLAVTAFDLDNLPVPASPARPAGMQTFATFEGVSFADVWMAHLGGQAMAERHVRLALGPVSKRANEQHIDLAAGTHAVLLAPDRGDVLAARLGLRTLIHHRARTGRHSLSADLWVALVHGLDIESMWTRRNRMRSATRTNRTLSQLPTTKTERVEAIARWQATSKAKTWDTLALDLSTDGTKAHASDPWFASGKQDAVAIELARRFRSGEADQRTRWDVFHLLEGFYARRLFPSDHAFVALDYALGLVDGAETIALGDVVRRHAFMTLARHVAAHPVEPSMDAMLDSLADLPGEAPDASTVWRWARGPVRPMFSKAMDLIRAS